jgi:ATP-dependent Clp protease ATP-binding subunit ClpX
MLGNARIIMSPDQTAIAILEYGKLLLDEHEHYCRAPDLSRLQQAEAQLIGKLQQDRSPSLKQVFGFNPSTSVDPLALRVLSHVAYLSLCTNCIGVSVSEVVSTLAGNDPARVLETRQTLSRLLIGRQLMLQRNNRDIELGSPLLEYLSGGKDAPPLAPTEWDLERVWRKQQAKEKTRDTDRPPCFEKLLTPQQLAERIAQDVVGLNAEIRTVACRLAMHMRRAALIRAGKDPGSPNEALLFVGPSGTGKTWVAETAGRVCGLPFGAISSTDLTCEGYIGLSPDDAIKQVIVAANNDVDQARYGICFFDEWDKKRSNGWEQGGPDISGASVQQSVLRLIEGSRFQVGGRRSSSEPTMIDTRGMFFVFAGAFNGLDKMISKRGVHNIGFASAECGAKTQQYLYDALQDYGLIPEFVNRLSGILVFPEPTVGQLQEITTQAVLPSINRMLATFGATVEMDWEAITLMAKRALETQTYSRGVKSILSNLIEEIVFEMRPGTIRLTGADVLRATKDAGLA